MGDVKRYGLMWDDYGDPGVSERENGRFVRYDDHLREVARLQRARARNLVDRLLLSGAWYADNRGFYNTEATFRKWANRIEAKYLKGEK